MESQVVEVVAYKIKEEFAAEYLPKFAPKFRELIKSFGGLVSYNAYSSVEKERVFFDHVVWEGKDAAFNATKSFRELAEKGEQAELLAVFEEMLFSDHVKEAVAWR